MDGDWFDSSVAKCFWPTLCEKKLGDLQIIQVPYIHIVIYPTCFICLF